MSKKNKTKDEVNKTKSALQILQSLVNKKPEDMKKDERALYDRAIGQLLGVLDVEGKVKV